MLQYYKFSYMFREQFTLIKHIRKNKHSTFTILIIIYFICVFSFHFEHEDI